jgi:D-amino-acid dehydrogenase
MNPDVAIVGGGAIGVCIARELALRGAKVALLERGPRVGCGCSDGNAGLICPSHSAPLATPAALRQGLRWLFVGDSPFHLKLRPGVVPWLARFAASSTSAKARAGTDVLRSLTLASLELHAELARGGLDAAYEQRGTLDVFETEDGFAAGIEKARDYAQAGVRSEILEAAAARALEPALAGPIAGAVHWIDEAHCDPGRFTAAVGAAAADAGAGIHTDCEVLELVVEGGRVRSLATTEGELAAGEVVLAAGAWTPALARRLGVRVPVEGGKGYHVELAPAASDPRIPVFFQDAWVIATPLPGRLRLAGTLELAGVDTSVDRKRVDAIFDAARTRLAGVTSSRIRHVWRGLRPCSPDGLPIVGRPHRVENLVLATGHTMLGLALAPLTGRVVAELIAGEPPSHDLTPLSPNRF